ncbi:MAG: TIGR02996 domain-containing protein [Planctomycetaceae bacterium]|nr:TIGR02996 domain-containing protein [Planctomycetaceae bacterium]
MSMKEAFLKALADNEDDVETRMVYSDWLDEQGEHEEAERQRQWPAAKAWLVEFCRMNNPDPDDPDPYECSIDYDELLSAAEEALKGDGGDHRLYVSCGSNMTMCDSLRAQSDEVWEKCSILLGLPLPPQNDRDSSFTCAC